MRKIFGMDTRFKWYHGEEDFYISEFKTMRRISDNEIMIETGDYEIRVYKTREYNDKGVPIYIGYVSNNKKNENLTKIEEDGRISIIKTKFIWFYEELKNTLKNKKKLSMIIDDKKYELTIGDKYEEGKIVISQDNWKIKDRIWYEEEPWSPYIYMRKSGDVDFFFNFLNSEEFKEFVKRNNGVYVEFVREDKEDGIKEEKVILSSSKEAKVIKIDEWKLDEDGRIVDIEEIKKVKKVS